MDYKVLIANSIETCKIKLNVLLQTTFKTKEDTLRWFQNFCNDLVNVILLYTEYSTSYKQNKAFCGSVLLHLMHLKEMLTLLIEIFTTEEKNKIIITEARSFVTKQLNWCLDGLLQDIKDPSALKEKGESFVYFIDLALEKLLEFDFNGDRESAASVLNTFRSIVEELLSYAMSVAQIATEYYGVIKGSCQSVLEALDSLEKEIEKDIWNPAMGNLFIDVCNDKLCILEKRVNITVLKLCLSTFSDFENTLERLHAYCLSDAEKTELEIDNLVAEFDLLVDKLMQIGFFAVACSTDTSRITPIKSCLVSLEALEVELVPALTATVLEKSLQNVKYAEILKQFWIEQTKALQEAVYFIIDPTAFCNVIYEEIRNNLEEIQINVLAKEDLQPILAKTRILINFIKKSSEDMSEEELCKTKPKYKKLKIAFQELNSAIDKLLSISNVDQNCRKRIFKRCKIVLNMAKQLWLCTTDNSKENIVKNCEIFAESIGNPLIDHCIERGQELLKERSILRSSNHTTKKSLLFSLNKDMNRETPLLKILFQKRLNFAHSQIKSNEMFNHTITGIANDMSNLTQKLEERNK